MHVRDGASARTRAIADLLEATPYALVGSLGRGGMGEVFVVEHELLGRRFALKLVHAHLARHPGLTERFQLEARTLARLAHRHIVQVTDFWIAPEGERPCLVLELLEGHTLAKELRIHRPLSPAEAVRITRQALSGLAAAHALGVVHRDIKPENIFLHRWSGLRGSALQPRAPSVKLLDFGLVRVLPGAPPEAPPRGGVYTSTGNVLGTPRYMSPEARSGKVVDHRADLYSVAVILYEMLAGQGPYDPARHDLSTLSRQLGAEAAQLGAILERALQPAVARRYTSALEFRAALERVGSASEPSS